MVNRREFLRTVSLGALAVGSAPALVDVARGLALAEGQRGVRFLAVSAAGTAPFSLPQAPRFRSWPRAPGKAACSWTTGSSAPTGAMRRGSASSWSISTA